MRVAIGLLACLMALVVGCGESDEDKAQNTAVAFFEHLGDREFEAACAMADGIGSGNIECEEVVRTLAGTYSWNFPEATGSIELGAASGEVEVESEGRLFTAHMQKVDDEWKVEDFDVAAATASP